MIMLFVMLLGIVGIIAIAACIVALVVKNISETRFAANGQEKPENQDQNRDR